jgi:hypothetical protein
MARPWYPSIRILRPIPAQKILHPLSIDDTRPGISLHLIAGRYEFEGFCQGKVVRSSRLWSAKIDFPEYFSPCMSPGSSWPISVGAAIRGQNAYPEINNLSRKQWIRCKGYLPPVKLVGNPVKYYSSTWGMIVQRRKYRIRAVTYQLLAGSENQFEICEHDHQQPAFMLSAHKTFSSYKADALGDMVLKI